MSLLLRPKLIFVVTEDWYFWAHRLALGRAALAAGYEVVIAARVQAHAARLTEAGFRVVALPWRRGGGGVLGELRSLFALYRLFRVERPQIVHGIALKAVVYAGLMARVAGGAARVSTIAGLGYVFSSDQIKARLLRWPLLTALRLAMGGERSLVTLENPDDAALLARANVLKAAQVALICGCGVDIAEFSPAPEPDGVPIVAMACRLVRDKGAGAFAAAARLLKAQGVAVRFRLAGGLDDGNPDGYRREEVEGWVAEGAVEWDGYVSDMPGFWRGCHIALYPSTYGEGLPKTLMEAAACGRAVVTTDMPGCREAVRDGVTGYLVPRDDPAAIADRIRRLVEDPALRRRMGAAGRQKALDEFADEHLINGTLAVYRRL